MDVLFLGPGYPGEMPLFTLGLAEVGARVIGVVGGDHPDPEVEVGRAALGTDVPRLETDDHVRLARGRRLVDRVGGEDVVGGVEVHVEHGDLVRATHRRGGPDRERVGTRA